MKPLNIRQTTIKESNKEEFDKQCNKYRTEHDVIAEQTTALYNGEQIFHIAVIFYQEKEVTTWV